MLIVTVAGSSSVAILSVPGVPPVFPRCDSSGTTNQKSVSTCAFVSADIVSNKAVNELLTSNLIRV
jgi:hypothetical protein